MQKGRTRLVRLLRKLSNIAGTCPKNGTVALVLGSLTDLVSFFTAATPFDVHHSSLTVSDRRMERSLGALYDVAHPFVSAQIQFWFPFCH
jgi:hypothetical protein